MEKRYPPKHAGPKSDAYIMAETVDRLIVLDGGTTKRIGKHHYPHADVVIKTQEAQHRFCVSRIHPRSAVAEHADAA